MCVFSPHSDDFSNRDTEVRLHLVTALDYYPVIEGNSVSELMGLVQDLGFHLGFDDAISLISTQIPV